MKKILSYLAGIMLTCSLQASETSLLQQALNKQIIEDKLANGAVVVTYENGKVTPYHTGIAQKGSDAAVDANALFEIGSITKAFTGVLLADMVTKGEVKLDDPVQKYLPKSVTMPTSDGKQITLQDLANHRSGLPRLPTNIEFTDVNNPYATYTVDKMYQFLSSYKLPRAIGAEAEYSNLGTGLLGHVLGLAAGKPYAELVQQRILKPLGMTQSFIHVPKTYLRATPHGADGNPVSHWDIPVLGSAGAINATIGDMAKFLQANLNPQGPLKAAIELSHQVTNTMGQSEIGLGWIVTKNYIWHNGGTGGFRTFLGFDKANQKGIVLMANTSFSLDEIGHAYLQDKLPKLVAELTKETFKVSAADLGKLNGQYQLMPGFVLTVTNDGEQLLIQATGQQNVPVYPKSKTRFFYKVVQAEVEFELGDDGKAIAVTLFQAGQQMKGSKL